MNDLEKLIKFIWVETLRNLADMMTKSQPESIGLPQREAVMGGPSAQKHFNDTPPELLKNIQKRTIFVSDDKGKNWYLPDHFEELEIDITPFTNFFCFGITMGHRHVVR